MISTIAAPADATPATEQTQTKKKKVYERKSTSPRGALRAELRADTNFHGVNAFIERRRARGVAAEAQNTHVYKPSARAKETRVVSIEPAIRWVPAPDKQAA